MLAAMTFSLVASPTRVFGIRYLWTFSNYSHKCTLLRTRARSKMASGIGEVGSGRSERSQRRALLGDDDATMVFETSKGVDVIPTFDNMGLRENLLRGIYAYGKLQPPNTFHKFLYC